VNDIVVDPKNNLLFSCSNDKSVKLWKIPNEKDFKTQNSSFSFRDYHSDYIKALSFSSEANSLFSGSLDGRVVSYNLEEFSNKSLSSSDGTIYSSSNSESIYSMDIDLSGKLLLVSIYKTNLILLDTRSRDECFRLRGHKDIIRNIRISPDGRMVII